MIDALIAGKLYGTPEQRTGKSGKPFVVAKVRAAVGGDEQAVFVNVLAFDEGVQAALLALDDGCAVALSGSITPEGLDRQGGQRAAEPGPDRSGRAHGLPRQTAATGCHGRTP